MARRNRDEEIARVAQHVRRFDVVIEIAELKTGIRRDHRAELSLDADVTREVDGDRRSKPVVAEARRGTLRREIRRTRRDVRGFYEPRTWSRLLGEGASDADECSDDDESCDPA